MNKGSSIANPDTLKEKHLDLDQESKFDFDKMLFSEKNVEKSDFIGVCQACYSCVTITCFHF